MIIKYDFLSDHSLSAVAEVCEVANVEPLSVTFNSTVFDNVSIEFKSHSDAIRFTETYLDSTDPTEITLYINA